MRRGVGHRVHRRYLHEVLSGTGPGFRPLPPTQLLCNRKSMGKRTCSPRAHARRTPPLPFADHSLVSQDPESLAQMAPQPASGPTQVLTPNLSSQRQIMLLTDVSSTYTEDRPKGSSLGVVRELGCLGWSPPGV